MLMLFMQPRFFNSKVANPKEGMEKSYNEILKIFNILGKDPSGKVFRGSTNYLKNYKHPLDSEAARDLVKRAMSAEDLLYVVSIGAITNIASAILMEPEIIRKIVVVWLGGHPHYWPQTWEFNLMQDVLSSQLVFDCGVPLIQIPCMGVASQLTTTEYELDYYLTNKSRIGTYLSDTVKSFTKDENAFEEYNAAMDKYLEGTADYEKDVCANMEYQPDTYAWSKIIWDISAIAYLINPGWLCTTLVNAPVLLDNFKWKIDSSRHLMRVCNFIKRDCVFGDMFKKLAVD